MIHFRQPRFGGYFHPFPVMKSNKVLAQAEAVLQRPIEVAMWYQQWGAGWGIKHFHPNWVKSAGARDVVIKWDPMKLRANPTDPAFSIKSIINGAHDTYIESWARAIGKIDKTIYLCSLSEMNGFWHGWSKTFGLNTPDEYVQAWRHLHEIFANVGTTNARWIWAPNAGDTPDDNRMEDYYPGSEYVDVLGLSVYNWGTVKTWSRWRSFAEIIQPYYDRIGKLGSQPIWIAEMGCAPVGGDKAAWIVDMWNYLPNLPRIDTLLWFNINKETDWRATEVPEAFSSYPRTEVLG